MYNLSVSALASNEINRLACAISRACGSCWVRACALASDCARLIEMPVYSFHIFMQVGPSLITDFQGALCLHYT